MDTSNPTPMPATLPELGRRPRSASSASTKRSMRSVDPEVMRAREIHRLQHLTEQVEVSLGDPRCDPPSTRRSLRPPPRR